MLHDRLSESEYSVVRPAGWFSKKACGAGNMNNRINGAINMVSRWFPHKNVRLAEHPDYRRQDKWDSIVLLSKSIVIPSAISCIFVVVVLLYF